MASLSDGPSFLQHSDDDEFADAPIESMSSPEPRKKRPIWVWVAVGAGIAACLGVGVFRLNTLLHAGESEAYVAEAMSEDERRAEEVEQTEDIGQTADAGQFDVETYEDDDSFGSSASGSIPVQDDAASDDHITM